LKNASNALAEQAKTQTSQQTAGRIGGAVAKISESAVTCDGRNGAAERCVPIEEHVAFCIAAMRAMTHSPGLKGNSVASA
jgi:hypothetical protein